MNSFGVDKAVTFRQPSTANLLVDSSDKVAGVSPWDFQITRPNSVINGFFNRIGTTEVVLEWTYPNLSEDELLLDISGTSVRSTVSFGDPLVESFTTVAQFLNIIPGTYNGVTLAIVQTGSKVSITATGGTIRAVASSMATKLGLFIGGPAVTALVVGLVKSPDLRRYRYLDFTSNQLTYCQDVKDASTSLVVRDVLCRWYMAFDDQPILDSYGFPVLMGYTPFVVRRLFNPPKQIKWDNSQPVGNLAFQVFGDTGEILIGDASNWLMTLQLSEN